MNITLLATDRDVTRACTHQLPTGVSTHVMALARGLVDDGHEVTVVTGRDDRAGVDLSYRHEAGGGLSVVRLSRESIHAVTPGAGRIGHDLADVLEAAAPDVVHAHGSTSGVLAADAARATGVPWVSQPHAGAPASVRTPDDQRRRRAERDVLREADRVVALSTDEAAGLIAAGVRPDLVEVVPRVVDPTVFDVRGSSMARPHKVGRIVAVVDDHGPTSGLTETIKAVSKVPHVELVVVGGAGQGALVNDPALVQATIAARQLGVAERMTITGRLSPTRLAEAYRSADVVLHVPSEAAYADHVLEAMSCARPVIATSVGGTADIVDHGVSGLCVPPRSPQRLTDALRLVLCEKEQRLQMGQLARRRVQDVLSLGPVVASTTAAYRRTLLGAGLGARAS